MIFQVNKIDFPQAQQYPQPIPTILLIQFIKSPFSHQLHTEYSPIFILSICSIQDLKTPSATSVLVKQLIILIFRTMQSQKCFQTATLLFYENKLEEALLILNQTIRLKPSSVAFSNRALIHLHLNHPSQARQDIALALSIDPLNFAAYLNLSSIDTRQQDLSSAIENLTCAIAALKLIHGRRTKQRQEVLESLELCPNSFDALVLLVLMDTSQGNFEEALQVITKYERYQEDKLLARRLKNTIEELIQNYSYQREEAIYELLQGEAKQGRLQCCFKANTMYLQEQMTPALMEKLEEFNKYYSLNNTQFAKTKHLPTNTNNYTLIEQPQPTNSLFSPQPPTKELISSH